MSVPAESVMVTVTAPGAEAAGMVTVKVPPLAGTVAGTGGGSGRYPLVTIE